MLKRVLLSASLLLALVVPSRAFAAYVCQAEYFPGSIARIKLMTSTSPSCAGTTNTYWVCESTNTSGSCGLRYTVPEQLALLTSLTSAAKTQQVVLVSTTTCANGTSGCFYSAAFRP